MASTFLGRFGFGLPFVAGVLAAGFLTGCSPTSDSVDDETESSDEATLKNAEKTGSSSQKWIYEGAMPQLGKPEIHVSLKSHTARVTGLLPADFKGQLPFYAKPSSDASGLVRVTLVYPVATGKVDPSTGTAPMAPGHYSKLFGVAYTPTTDAAAWGGFPFLKYHASRGLAFHGPITSTRNADTGDWEWTLTRGPVSHGCERMVGEHVVELAHMLGMNMSAPHKVSDTAQLPVSVDVTTQWDSVDGKYIDVDYPALASVKRPPAAQSTLFPTWDSRNLPNVVCSYDAKRPLGGQCEGRGEVKQDIITGAFFAPNPKEPPPSAKWIGSACTADTECGFSADGEKAHCLKSGSHGFCTISCEGYCPDQSGSAPTFCAATEAGGACFAKAATENSGCQSIPGTSPEQAARFIGSSGASQKTATVCSF